MTPEWKAKVRAALAERGETEQWLADRIGEIRGRKIKRDTVNKMLRHQSGSSFVPDVCMILGLPPPTVATPAVHDARSARVLELMNSAPEEKRDLAIAMLETLFKQR